MNSWVINKRVKIPIDTIELNGMLAIPAQAFALILFAHGSGSSMLSPRNQMVANYLNKRKIGTLLFDLLTYDEDREYANRFNIALLAQRLMSVTLWVLKQNLPQELRMGYFGASTGAAAALVAATGTPQISAIVSRGGRPDLADNALHEVKAATLLIVGSLDSEVIKLNKKALNMLACEKKIEIIPGATHLFEEEGAMEKVCVLAANWFEMHLQPLKISD